MEESRTTYLDTGTDLPGGTPVRLPYPACRIPSARAGRRPVVPRDREPASAFASRSRAGMVNRRYH